MMQLHRVLLGLFLFLHRGSPCLIRNSSCHPPWIHGQGKCLRLTINIRATWDEAAEECKEHGGYLVYIQSAAEHKSILDIFSHILFDNQWDQLWIGLYWDPNLKKKLWHGMEDKIPVKYLGKDKRSTEDIFIEIRYCFLLQQLGRIFRPVICSMGVRFRGICRKPI